MNSMIQYFGFFFFFSFFNGERRYIFFSYNKDAISSNLTTFWGALNNFIMSANNLHKTTERVLFGIS